MCCCTPCWSGPGLSELQQLYSEGNHYLNRGELAAAEQCFLQVLEAQPLHAAARANLAYLKGQQRCYAEAEFHYRQALALMPDHVQLQQNFATLLWQMKRLAEAEQLARAALLDAPDDPALLTLLGVILACGQREAEAQQAYQLALQRDPHYARARFNLAYLLLRQGRLKEGWPLLAARWEFEALGAAFGCPQWQGESLQDKSIMLALEAGQGDMIQFSRYAALLKQRGARKVALVCQPALKRLFASLSGVDQVFAFDEPCDGGPWDYWSHPMHLPVWFDTTLASIPAAIPYLASEAELVEHWRSRLPAAGLRVGLVWQGNPEFENDGERSLPSLHTLAPLAQVANVEFISLQYGVSRGGLGLLPEQMRLTVLGDQLRDFADTAAILSQCDLLISVDTAAAHLAGALGVPCWLLLPDYRCDWRWLTQRSDSPWYPSMRLYRQPAGGQTWRPVAEQLRDALAVLAQEVQ